MLCLVPPRVAHQVCRVVAMSVPAERKSQQLYRNPIDEVARFFDTKVLPLAFITPPSDDRLLMIP